MNEISQTVKREGLVTAGVEKIRTMIEGFDDISHGGMPLGRTTLVSGTSGTGKTLFAVQFLYNGITHFDEAGVFVTFEESPAGKKIDRSCSFPRSDCRSRFTSKTKQSR